MFLRTVKNSYHSDTGNYSKHKPILLPLLKACRSHDFHIHLPQTSKYNHILGLQNTDLWATQRGLKSRMQWCSHIIMAEHLNARTLHASLIKIFISYMIL